MKKNTRQINGVAMQGKLKTPTLLKNTMKGEISQYVDLHRGGQLDWVEEVNDAL